MKIKINITDPNEFERELIAAAGRIWIEKFLEEIPLEVVMKNQEATYLASRLEPDNRTYHRKIRTWWKISGVWERLSEIRVRRVWEKLSEIRARMLEGDHITPDRSSQYAT